MKKWLGILGIVAAVAGTWWLARTYWRVNFSWDAPKTAVVSRGEIRVPVSATGLIEPEQRIEIKPEASGEVIEVSVVEGDFVHTGDVLILLRPDDEQRNLDRAKAQLDRARASYERAKIAVDISETDLLSAEARVDQLQANHDRAKFDRDRLLDLEKREVTDPREMMVADTSLRDVAAQLKAAQANLAAARVKIDDAKQFIEIQDAGVREASKTLEDAEKRVRDTTIKSRGDAIVTEVRVRKGNLVQSGIGTVTSGSVLVVLADVQKLKVVTRVDEADYGRIVNIAPVAALPDMPGKRDAVARDEADFLEKRSGKVRITVDAFPDRTFEGRIERVEPQGKLNPGASVIQFDVHVQITDADKYRLPLGTQAQVEFTVESVADALLVPAEAVKTFEEEKGVWIVAPPPPGEQHGKKFVRCRFGITDGVNTQVVSTMDDVPLEPGTKVYTKPPVEREDKRK